MKISKRFLIIAVCILTVLSCIPCSANVPYSTYTYDLDGNFMESPHAFVPYTVIDSKTMGLEEPITDSSDLFVDDEGNIYISDLALGRVIVCDPDGNAVYEYSDFVNEWGVPDAIQSPNGLYVSGQELYIADSNANRILVFSTVGEREFVRSIEEPESDVFPDGHIYKPVAVAVGNSGYIYVVSSTTYQGIIAMNAEGKFTNFLGTQTQKMSLFDILWRRFQTAEQRSSSLKNVSTEFNNITIDDEGFIYATTASINEEDLASAITGKDTSSTYAPVKKFNPDGDDVMKRTGFYPPSGEIKFNQLATPTSTTVGPSKIVDVALGPEGMWSIIDAKRQRIFTYDEEGVLLFAFGDKGNQLGNIQSVKAIDYQGSNLLVLDDTNNNITVFKRTEYGDALAVSLKHQRERNYDKSTEDWTNILQKNTNFDMSYIGIGKSLYRSGEYEKAMEYYKSAYDIENYSEAYQAYRKDLIEKYIIVIPIVIIILCVLLSKFNKYVNNLNIKGQSSEAKKNIWTEFCYGFHVIYHPFDGFWDLKHEKRGSLRASIVIVVLTILSFIYQQIGSGYVVNPHPQELSIIMSISSILLPILLWVVANWCLTTLFDGEGSLKDIFITTSYALFPLPAFVVVTTIASNYVTSTEASLITLAMSVGYVWVGFLIFFGTMVVHDYTLFKNVCTSIASIVGMAFIMFVGVLFSSLVGKIFSFIYNIVLELSYRV